MTTTAANAGPNFLEIQTNQQLAEYLGIPLKELTFLAYGRPSNLYSHFRIPKKSGGFRLISAPRSDLKRIQRAIAAGLAEYYKPPLCVFGFVPSRSVADNANRHIRKRFLLSLDLKNFFPSISSGRVRQLFHKALKFPEELSNTLTNLVCHDKCLPQGAPTSPIISNIICFKMDRALLSFAARLRVDYTRYADDITFSATSLYAAAKLFDRSKTGLSAINPVIRNIISSNHFEINEDKVHVAGHGTRQLVNGIVVNDKCNMPRETYRSLRALFHTWKNKGYQEALRQYVEASPIYMSRLLIDGQPCTEAQFAQHVRGRLDYYTMVVTVNGRTNGPIEKLWTMFHDITGEDIPLASPERYGIRIDTYRDIQGKDVLETTCGTSFLFEGNLVTCRHCLPEAEADNVEVVMIQNHRTASVALDTFKRLSVYDFAYARLEDNVQGFISINRSNIRYVPQRGETVVAVGCPGGGDAYKVTAKVRGTTPEGYVLVDRAFIQGMSGGPVLNSRGELIGLVTKGSAEDAYSRDGQFIPTHLLAEYAPFSTQPG